MQEAWGEERRAGPEMVKISDFETISRMLEILANRRFENFGRAEDGIVERLSESLLTGYSDERC